MSTILIPIKPEYAYRIFNGEKKYEYRRKLPKKPVFKMYVYATSPVKAVIGEVTVIRKLEAKPADLWELTKDEAGISAEKYEEYFKNHNKAYAYKLGKTTLYPSKKTLADYGITRAPQSYTYV